MCSSDLRFVVSATGFTYSTKTLRMAMGTPPNAPKALSKVSSTVKKRMVTVTIPNIDVLTTYDTYLRSAKTKKSIPLKCRQTGKTVTCVSTKLAAGSWNLSITPTKDGMAATSSKKVVKVP